MTVFLNGRFFSQVVTGVQRYAHEMVRALDDELVQQGHDGARRDLVLLVPPGLSHPPSFALIKVREVGLLRGQLWEQVELAYHARGEILVSLANLAPLLKHRQLVTIHDASTFAVPEAYTPWFGSWYRFALPELGRNAALIATVSHFSKAELEHRARIPSAKIRVVYPSGEHIQSAPADASILHRLGLGHRPFALAVASRSRHKNLLGIIRALELLDDPHFDMVVVGGRNARVFGGTDEQLTDRVKHAGYVRNAELRTLYEHASCFVYPSRYEGFGLPPVEAMSCGCPVIASRAASLREVCGDAALYCDPDDPHDIATQIALVMGDPSIRAQLRSRGLERARCFTWRGAARALLALIDELVTQ